VFGDKADDVDRGKAQGVEGYMYMVLSEAFESFEHKIPRHSGPESRPAVASFGRRKVESMVQVLYLGRGVMDRRSENWWTVEVEKGAIVDSVPVADVLKGDLPTTTPSSNGTFPFRLRVTAMWRTVHVALPSVQHHRQLKMISTKLLHTSYPRPKPVRKSLSSQSRAGRLLDGLHDPSTRFVMAKT